MPISLEPGDTTPDGTDALLDGLPSGVRRSVVRALAGGQNDRPEAPRRDVSQTNKRTAFRVGLYFLLAIVIAAGIVSYLALELSLWISKGIAGRLGQNHDILRRVTTALHERFK